MAICHGFITQDDGKRYYNYYDMLHYVVGRIATAQWIFECTISIFWQFMLPNGNAMAKSANVTTWNDRINTYGSRCMNFIPCIAYQRRCEF